MSKLGDAHILNTFFKKATTKIDNKNPLNIDEMFVALLRYNLIQQWSRNSRTIPNYVNIFFKRASEANGSSHVILQPSSEALDRNLMSHIIISFYDCAIHFIGIKFEVLYCDLSSFEFYSHIVHLLAKTTLLV